ncbi:MAG: prolyl oligopeptidase family serine peptidase [Caldithrix sp.]|nr:prolyl oligopeptidase family serine peptidase [Caldithrix sp.]
MLKVVLNGIIITGVIMMAFACQTRERQTPPDAEKQPKTDTLFGDVRVDNYYWLRNRDSAKVLDYLKAENEYAASVMEPTKDLQNKLYDEMLGRIKETDLSVPVKKDNYFYYTRTEEGKQYPIHCRKKGSLEADEEVILDENLLAKGHDYFNTGIFEVSPNHQLLAYSTDTTGGETYTIYVKDLTSGKMLNDRIPNTYYSVEWGNDDKTLFYNTLDDAKRPYSVYRHKLGQPVDKDELLYQEEDEKFFLDISKTRSNRYILLNMESKTTTEVRYLNADQPSGTFKLLQKRVPGMEYYVAHHSQYFYIYMNKDAINFKLVKTPVRQTAMENWQTVIPHRQNIMINGIDLFQDYIVVYERKDGLKQIHIREIGADKGYYIDFTEPAYATYAHSNPQFKSEWLRFTYTSLKTPNSVYEYNMRTQERILKKQKEVLGGYDPDDYQIERVYAKAVDGTKIPLSIIYKKGIEKNGNHPTLLYGYGSYGISVDPTFSSNRFSLIDRGFIYAIAHIRGGGEMGRPWYENGKMLNKKNTFNDFIACAEYLINQNYTNSRQLAIRGGSAGGLLMGAVMNQRPDLFEVVVAHVPFVDVINTMLDETIPLTVTEYEEWGNPNKEKYYHYMKSYAPYENVQKQKYPHILVTAGLNDPRVQYWEPAKWTAKLRDRKIDNNTLVLKTNMGAGHGGASGRYDYLKEKAYEFAFIIKYLDV